MKFLSVLSCSSAENLHTIQPTHVVYPQSLLVIYILAVKLFPKTHCETEFYVLKTLKRHVSNVTNSDDKAAC